MEESEVNDYSYYNNKVSKTKHFILISGFILLQTYITNVFVTQNEKFIETFSMPAIIQIFLIILISTILVIIINYGINVSMGAIFFFNVSLLVCALAIRLIPAEYFPFDNLEMYAIMASILIFIGFIELYANKEVRRHSMSDSGFKSFMGIMITGILLVIFSGILSWILFYMKTFLV
ncbi:MAG: hypothetical protein KC589_04230 [Nanoarchaeota archaeon]|nr:hypothetical protein [Nanoarchaeota archaeon]MCA9496125.1 hypothetical protein [Nanoarchaeota archaeon]